MEYCSEEHIEEWANDSSTSHIVFQAIHGISNSIAECVEKFYNPKYELEVCESILAYVKPLFLEYNFIHLPYLTWSDKTVYIRFAYIENGKAVEMAAETFEEALVERPLTKIMLITKVDNAQCGAIALN